MVKKITSFEQYKKIYEESVKNPEKFWAEQAESFVWHKKWDKVLEWNFIEPKIEWFKGSKLNITENCLDRHAKKNPNKVALIWEANDPNEKGLKFSYQELLEEVCKMANLLKNQGVKKGDRVCIYMPMIPQLMIAFLACARIGAISCVVFAGFSAQAFSNRVFDTKAKLIITADGAFRGEKEIEFKPIIDEVLKQNPQVEKVLVFEKISKITDFKDKKYLNATQELAKMPKTFMPESMNAEDPLFILYTSGSTGKPKGVLHTIAGYMVFSQYSFENVFNFSDGDIFWCTADLGWITGHTYSTFAPLLSGATTLMFEGIPTYPDASRFWQIIDKYQVNIFYTAPTAIRSLMSQGLDFVKPFKLDSLKTLGTVGEPINEEAWHWYNENIGKKKCPIADTWWQTETGGIAISALAGVTPTKPSFATLPLAGVQPILVDDSGNEIKENNVTGNLCLKFPLPSMIRTTYGDHERCKQNYFATFKNLYFAGDGAFRDKDGYYRIVGRVDDVINVSGHRLGTAEIENAINATNGVSESAVIGYPHEIKGEGIFAFVIAKNQDEETKKALIANITKTIGAIAKPDEIRFVRDLPKTRSGKIMRRILKKIVTKDFENLGDISTLVDPKVVEEIIEICK